MASPPIVYPARSSYGVGNPILTLPGILHHDPQSLRRGYGPPTAVAELMNEHWQALVFRDLVAVFNPDGGG